MGFRPHPKNAAVDPSDLHGAAWSASDGSGFQYNHRDLVWQWQWQGPQLVNLRYLVGPNEVDEPSEFLRTIILPPDPLPTLNARIENYADDENSYRATQDGAIRELQTDGDLRIVEIADDELLFPDTQGN